MEVWDLAKSIFLIKKTKEIYTQKFFLVSNHKNVKLKYTSEIISILYSSQTLTQASETFPSF